MRLERISDDLWQAHVLWSEMSLTDAQMTLIAHFQHDPRLHLIRPVYQGAHSGILNIEFRDPEPPELPTCRIHQYKSKERGEQCFNFALHYANVHGQGRALCHVNKLLEVTRGWLDIQHWETDYSVERELFDICNRLQDQRVEYILVCSN